MCNFHLLTDLSFSHLILWISHSLENSALVVSRLRKEWVNVHDMQANKSMLHLQIMTILESISPKTDKLYVSVQSLFSTTPPDSHKISLWTGRLDITVESISAQIWRSNLVLNRRSLVKLIYLHRWVSCNFGFSFFEARSCLRMIQVFFACFNYNRPLDLRYCYDICRASGGLTVGEGVEKKIRCNNKL
jgi:hypothetical protein